MYKGVLEGQTSAGKFLEMLATSEQEAVQVRSLERFISLRRLLVFLLRVTTDGLAASQQEAVQVRALVPPQVHTPPFVM